MVKKNKKDKTKSRPVRRSLSRKTFFITMALTLGIGATVLLAGLVLYVKITSEQYFMNTWNMANAEAAVIEQDDFKDKCDSLIRIYDSIPEEDRGDGTSLEYRARFDSLIDNNFAQLQRSMRDLKDRNGPMNAFIVAIDRDTDRMIYLIDSDSNPKTFCHPGTWDSYSDEEMEILVNGRDSTIIQRKSGFTERIQAVITDLPQYGIRCTAGSTLYQYKKYTIMICVDEKMEPLMDVSKLFFTQYILLLVFVTLIASFIGMLLLRRNMVKPINSMAAAARAYAEDREINDESKHFDKLNINTGDEIENLAVTLRDLEEDVADYMDNLAKASAEKERIATELSLAARIQKSMLHDEFPAFPDRAEFDVYASMEPARDVGGDFYDLFLIDDDHLAIEIADVSDKSVPAAIFMTASKIVLADRAMEGLSPAQVLEKANNRICKGNRSEMFVTVWLGILEISTGKLTAANAGHEYPVIIHADGKVETIHDKHGFVIGGLEDMKYTDYEVKMKKGDRILVYTDGVTEASKADYEQFGMARLIEALEKAGGGIDPEETIRSVRASIGEFVGDAEQFDDLTMLCMEYRGE